MKKCKYCDSELDNSVTECPSCGASDFIHICDCCGTSFDDGLVCPSCGVRLGDSPRTCPTCGKVYYGASCPRCGHREPANTPSDEKGPSVLLWIMGFLLCFPITLVLFFLNRSGLQIKVRRILRIVVWGFGILVAIQISMSVLVTLLT